MDTLNILSNKKVLYAEDEKGIAKNITEVLELFFDKVVNVDDGLDALDEFHYNKYDVLICDISIPTMDCLEVLQQIRQINKTIPIVILSAHTQKEYLWRAVELKITKYLVKPYDKTTLLQALEDVALELVNYNTTIDLNDKYSYNPCNKSIFFENIEIKLTKNESKLLEYFINRANQPITFEDIYDYIWESQIPSKEALKSIIKDLRKKISKDFIKNIYGVGYIFEY